MSAIPPAYLVIIEPLIAVARDLLERGEQLVPIAFVGNLTTAETRQVVLSTASEQAKDDSATLIRHLAAIHQADFVFVVMDAWALRPDKARRYEEIIERYGSIGASPYRVDIVTFSLETHHGLWVAQAPVKPKGVSKRRKTFAAPKFERVTEAGGRFVDLLPARNTAEMGSGVLH